MAGSGVTPASLRAGLLQGLIGPGATFASLLDGVLLDAIVEAESQVEHELSTRFDVTEFRGFMGPGASPAVDGVEFEGPYAWPGAQPGDRFPVWQTRIRPVIELKAVTVSFPGGLTSPVDLGLGWFRVDHLLGEVTLAPQGSAAPLYFQGLAAPFVGMGGHQIPSSVLLNYTAGLGPAGLKRYPKVNRLVGILASVQLLPQLSLLANPDILTSISADGLSQSRASGYVYKDLEDRLIREAEEVKSQILALWEGPSLSVL